MKEAPGDTIILHMYTHYKRQPHHVWFLRYRAEWTEFFTLDHFLPFFPSNNPKNQNFENMKKCLVISSFYTSVPKIMIICYTVPKIERMTDVIFIFHFKLFFALLSPNDPQN